MTSRLPTRLAAAWAAVVLLLACSPAAHAQPKPRDLDPAQAQKARRALEEATGESQRTETSARRAQERLRAAEARLRAAQAEVEAAQRDNQSAQQRASAARNAENRARRELDASLARSR